MFIISLYIFRFLHQTTTQQGGMKRSVCCISFVSYIKPQPSLQGIISSMSCISFVSYIKPQQTSLKRVFRLSCISFVSYIKPQRFWSMVIPVSVVYLSFPTSNHNILVINKLNFRLYIFRFLHQTTTFFLIRNLVLCCISFVSYIKPQQHVSRC